MNILYIITQADGGGAQKYTLTLAKYFGGAIASGDEAKKLFTDAEQAGLYTYTLKHLKRDISPLNDFLAIWEIRQLIQTLKPDIVHLNSTKAGILGSFAAVGLKTKVIFTAHGFRFNEPLSFASRQFYVALETIASSYRSFIITVSENDEKTALANKLISPNKIRTIHNGLGPIDFLTRDEARTALNLSPHKIIIGCVANFYISKGVDVFIDAVSLLADEEKNKIEVSLIGNGQEFENYKLKIENLKLANIVKLNPNLEAADKYLKAFDLFVLPSRKEGFPYALLEAMQAGLPIIATNVGGNPEALGDAGILVTPERPEEMARTIEILISDEPQRQKLSQKSLGRSKLFTEEKMLLQTQKVYENLF